MNSFFAASDKGGSYWYGAPATEVAQDVHWLFDVILWVSAIAFFIIIGVGSYFIVKYRRREGVDAIKTSTHNTALELLWSVIPTIFVVAIFWWGFETYMEMKKVPDDKYTVYVEASKWNWSFEYPGGVKTGELVVPAGRNIELVLSSKDVLHSFAIPDFAIKQDCVPGRYTKLWFNAPNANTDRDAAGDLKGHVIFCTEYCGTKHSRMMAKCSVVDEATFEAWYLKEANFLDNPDITPVEKGRKIYSIQGCAGCHSLDGKNNVASGGPTFKGLWNKSREFSNAESVVVDENYIRESILNPNEKVVAGYPKNRMTNYNGTIKDEEIRYLIDFIKSMKGE